MTKLDAGLIISLPASDPGSAAVWGSKRINPRPQFCLCLAWSGCPSNDDDDDDESRDICSCAQLMVYARYVSNNAFKEEFLFCFALETIRKAADILNKVTTFFTIEGLEWENLAGCSTDGVPAMLKCNSGFQASVKRQAPKSKGVHSSNKMRKTEHCALKLTIFIIEHKLSWATAHFVRCNGMKMQSKQVLHNGIKRNKQTYVT